VRVRWLCCQHYIRRGGREEEKKEEEKEGKVDVKVYSPIVRVFKLDR